MIGTYRKHNSFIAFRQQDAGAESAILQRIAACCARGDLTAALSAAHRDVLACAVSDLTAPGDGSDGAVFRLSPNVVHEIDTLPDAVLPRYLVHRYRYEIFPDHHIVDAYPPYLQIEPTSMCNYRCVFCYETDRTFTRKSNGHMGFMPLDTFRRAIDQAEGNIEFISLASRGEPLLCPDIELMLAYTRGKFLNLKMNTNASLLDEKKAHAILQSGIKTLVFSADAAEEPLYSQLRVNGRLDIVLANIERFRSIKEAQYPESNIVTRVSGVKFNAIQNIDSMEKLWGSLVDQVAFVAYNPWENTYKRAPSEVAAPCTDLWRRMFVWWDGKINPCDVDYKSTLSVGNLATANLSEQWNSVAYTKLRQSHLTQARGSVEPCRRCTVI